ncbi:hypothetical protein M5689_012880 [Euphorbia peplus]|nr:hypothetical protein M5689_012880 [Euphorbia peplus]
MVNRWRGRLGNLGINKLKGDVLRWGDKRRRRFCDHGEFSVPPAEIEGIEEHRKGELDFAHWSEFQPTEKGLNLMSC